MKSLSKYITESVDKPLKDAIIDLWHLSKTALAGSGTVPSRSDRMSYVKKELIRSYPKLIEGKSPKTIWLDIEEVTSPTY